MAAFFLIPSGSVPISIGLREYAPRETTPTGWLDRFFSSYSGSTTGAPVVFVCTLASPCFAFCFDEYP